MKPSEDKKLLEIVKATAEVYGRTISLSAAMLFLADLDNFDSEMVKDSLTKCRKELRTFPTVADVVARIDDGHVGVEEAWSLIPQNELMSVFMNYQIAEAYGMCKPLLNLGDHVAARMAFKEKYTKLLADARAKGERPTWFASLGHDPSGRRAAIMAAVEKKRITEQAANSLDPGWATEMKAIAHARANEPKLISENIKQILERIEK